MSFSHLKFLHFSKLLMLMPWECSARSQMVRPVSLQLKLLKPERCFCFHGKREFKMSCCPSPFPCTPLLSSFFPPSSDNSLHHFGKYSI